MEENVKENVQEKVQEGKNKKGIIIAAVVVVLVVAAIVTYLIINSKPNIAGNYDLVEMANGEETYTSENLSTLKNLGLTVSLEVNADGTGKLSMFGQSNDFTYDSKNFTIEGDACPYTVDGNKITLQQDDMKMVFEKQQ